MENNQDRDKEEYKSKGELSKRGLFKSYKSDDKEKSLKRSKSPFGKRTPSNFKRESSRSVSARSFRQVAKSSGNIKDELDRKLGLKRVDKRPYTNILKPDEDFKGTNPYRNKISPAEELIDELTQPKEKPMKNIVNDYSIDDLKEEISNIEQGPVDELMEELTDGPSVDDLLSQLSTTVFKDKDTSNNSHRARQHSRKYMAPGLRGKGHKISSPKPVHAPARPFDNSSPPADKKTERELNAKKPPMKKLNKVEIEENRRRKKAQVYDWGKTAKLSADQKKFLERIFNQFADYVTTKMAPLVQSRIALELQSTKLRPYSNFIQGLYEPITLLITRMDENFQGLMAVDFPLSFALIDKCLGGKGEPLDEVRYFTEIETAIFERITQRLIESYQDAWSEIKECKPELVEMEFNPQTVHITKPSELMVCILFDVRIAHTQGPLYVVLPFEYLKTVLPKANFEEFMLTRTVQTQANPTVAPLFAKNLEQAKIPVSVELGNTELLFQELAVLEVGDFIKLDQEISKPLRVKVNEKVKFLGRPGVRESKIAIQVTKVLQEGDDEFEE